MSKFIINAKNNSFLRMYTNRFTEDPHTVVNKLEAFAYSSNFCASKQRNAHIDIMAKINTIKIIQAFILFERF